MTNKTNNKRLVRKGPSTASWFPYAFLLAAVFAAAFAFTLQGAEEVPADLVSPEFAEQVPYLSGKAMLLAAKSLGMTEIMGKPLLPDVSSGDPPPQAQAITQDVNIGTHPSKSEEEPTVVANPINANNLVAGSHFSGPPAPSANRCAAYNSFDGGMTWSAPILMPHLAASSSCSDPVLAYAPDGSRVYYAYMDIKSQALGGFDIVVSYSDDGGQTWIGPIIALNAVPAPSLPRFNYDKPWIGTHVDASQSNWVYVTATNFRIAGAIPPNSIDFVSSSNQGMTWSAPVTLDSGSTVPLVLVQGSRPTGGFGGDVLVAWYQSGTDGFLNGSFQIRTRRSPNNGASWDPIVVASVDSFETPFFLGPFASFFRWWTTMFPDVEIASDGIAHIVYTHDPVNLSVTPEDGDVRYIRSSGPPYNVWSAAVTINDDASPRAQGFASLETQELGVPRVHVTFFDSRLSALSNTIYDIFHTQYVGGRWHSNSRVSQRSSMNDFSFLGDYFDLTVNGDLIYQVWTDRRHHRENFIFINEDNLVGSRVIAPAGSQ